MKNRFLKEYIEAVLKEEWYLHSEKKTDLEPKKKKESFFDKVKGFFSGRGRYEDIANDWVEDRSMYYDIDVSDDVKEEVTNFVEKKYPLAKKRARGNEEKANALIKKALDIKFERQFKELSRKLNRLDDEEDL